jgi:ribonuclease HI
MDLFFDGASKGNPGRSGAGAVLYENGVEVHAESVFVGEKETNNVAEYTGLLTGLRAALKLGKTRVNVKGDSDLIIKQMNGAYKVKSPNLIELHKEAKLLASKFETITFTHVYRNLNSRADELANKSLSETPIRQT